MQTTVPSSQILVLAPGESIAAQNNAKGHLFEQFVARLMAIFGYEQPTREALNISSNGIELDVSSTHVLTRQKMIAECKAYSSAVSAKELAAFYGKLGSERFDVDNLFGYFIAIPGLTKEAREQGAKLESHDSSFRVYTSESLIRLLLDRSEIVPLTSVMDSQYVPDGPLSDEALVVTPDGLYYAVQELSKETRLPVRVLAYPVKPRESVPSSVVELLATAVHYTRGLPCVMAPSAGQKVSTSAPPPDDTVIEVTGSSSDFEYQFPAAPKYFVGRQGYVSEARDLLEQLCAENDGKARVLVFNALSGWGKSSLALRLIALAKSLDGSGVCIDCRTAAHSTFVPRAMRHALLKAQHEKLILLPSEASFASVASTLETLKLSKFGERRRPICIFFDQFENVFQNIALTREFRDLALGISELQAPLVIGFGWKTDFVAFTENYPYQLRDDIRTRATVFALAPFGPQELGELIARLQRSCGQKIHPYLRERIREYSQGLPWLFKKLGSHIIREIKDGATQDELLAEVLNIQALFDSDINGLMPLERQVLHAIARRAPMLVTEAADLAAGDTDIVQSLLNQRLLVSIGDKLDVYWDVFRDYLNQGTVPLQESYILRLTPNNVSRLLIEIKGAGGMTTPDQAAADLNTSVISVLNMARDLRQLGVLAAQEGVLRFADDIAASAEPNGAVRARAAVALKRHRVYSLLSALAPVGSRLPLSQLTAALPKAYPAVAAKAHTWATYARAFVSWFEFVGLLTVERDEIVMGMEAPVIDLFIPGKKRVSRGVTVFPRSPVQPVLDVLSDILAGKPITVTKSRDKAVADAKFIALIDEDKNNRLSLTEKGLQIAQAAKADRARCICDAIRGQPSYEIAERMLNQDPGTSPTAIGNEIAKHLKLDWSTSTANWVGKYVRGWMRAAGVSTAMRSKALGDEATGDLFEP